MEYNKPIYFLCYLSRSGSTLLAQKLNMFSDISVGIEAEFYDGFNRGNRVFINDIKELDDYLNITYQKVEKFKYWNINKNDLKKKLLKYGFPITYKEFLESCLNLYFADDSAKILIHKSEFYHLFIDEIVKLFPNTKFIFINRDPRAIFNSQKRSIDSKTKKPMLTDPYKFSIHYAVSQYVIKQNLKKDFFLVIKYEDLIDDEERVLKKIIKFLNVSSTKNEALNYYEKIPKEQVHLHKNLMKKNDKQRINAWEHELSKDEIYFLQKTLKKSLSFWQYEFKDIKFNELKDKKLFIRNYLKFKKFYFKFLISKKVKNE